MAFPHIFSDPDLLLSISFCWAFKALRRDRGVHLSKWRHAVYALDVFDGALRIGEVLVYQLILINLAYRPVQSVRRVCRILPPVDRVSNRELIYWH